MRLVRLKNENISLFRCEANTIIIEHGAAGADVVQLKLVVPVRREKEIQIGQRGRIVAKGRGKRGVLCNFFCG